MSVDTGGGKKMRQGRYAKMRLVANKPYLRV